VHMGYRKGRGIFLSSIYGQIPRNDTAIFKVKIKTIFVFGGIKFHRGYSFASTVIYEIWNRYFKLQAFQIS